MPVSDICTSKPGLSQPLVGFVPSPAYLQRIQQSTPAIAPLLKAFPTGQSATTNLNVYNWSGSGKQTQNEDFGLIRVDQIFNAKTSAFLRINFDQGRLVSPNGDTTGYLQDTVSTQNNPKTALSRCSVRSHPQF
jgi:hypothetical protein